MSLAEVTKIVSTMGCARGMHMRQPVLPFEPLVQVNCRPAAANTASPGSLEPPEPPTTAAAPAAPAPEPPAPRDTVPLEPLRKKSDPHAMRRYVRAAIGRAVAIKARLRKETLGQQADARAVTP